MEGITPNSGTSGAMLEKKTRGAEEALNCPRCNSTNTKFCYYNNYSLTQPRYLCKNCRRYWTQGGSLRTIPVGGGSRKNKKIIVSSSSSSTTISSAMDKSSSSSSPYVETNDNNTCFQANYFPNSMMMMSSSNAIYQSEFPMQEIKPTLGFSLENGYDGNQVQENGRVLFPFGDMNQLSNTTDHVEVEHNTKEQANSTGYNWNGVIGEGSSW